MTTRVVFRADASLQIGTGHVMRCLTLADAITARGGECAFLCREHLGNPISHIRDKGHVAHALPVREQKASVPATDIDEPAHAHWLGASWQQDAEACNAILPTLRPDWLVVDHYALDARWEKALGSHHRNLMVIDDLADRRHECDLLLDQTFGRNNDEYKHLVPATCVLLCGSEYALLRPEFAALRPYSLSRRKDPQLRQLLISMGGVDNDNATAQILHALRTCDLPPECRIIVVMGAAAPCTAEVRSLAEQMPWRTEVVVNVTNMAELMADSDLAIGAAGATSWERCCMGLPAILLVQAENQQTVARHLEIGGAVKLLKSLHGVHEQLLILLNEFVSSPSLMSDMCKAAARVADGRGLTNVIRHLER